MDKLEKYLDKIGLQYDPATYGNDYFYNVAPVKFPAVFVEYKAGDAETLRKVIKASRYAARYGYIIFSEGGRGGYNHFTVMNAQDKAEYSLYMKYRDKAAGYIAELMHARRTGAGLDTMTDREFNDYIRGIMDYYGECYKIDRQYNGENAA